MPNPYTMHRQRKKSQPQKVSCTSKRVRIHSGGRRIRIVGNQPIEEATSTGTRPIESEKEISNESEQKKPKKSKKTEQKKNE